MKSIPDSIRKSLLKRQEAMDRFQAKRESFLLAKAQITKDIEEARIIWTQTLEQLPNQEFNSHKKTDQPKQLKHTNRKSPGIRSSIQTSIYKPTSYHEQQQ